MYPPPPSPPARPLPRLFYAGDVPVEASVGGALLLYRLLLDYPADRLSIQESGPYVSRPERRLPGVGYQNFPVARERLLRTRLHSLYSLWLTSTVARHAAALARGARAFGAEAILSVSHGFGWLAAAAAGRQLGLPLHLIAHDEWLDTLSLPAAARPWAQRRFCAVYRRAATRLCVSPYMARDYREICGVDGEVIYPSRAPAPVATEPPPADAVPHPGGVVFGFAGSIHSPEYARRLETVARALQPAGGRVRVFGPNAPSVFAPDTPSNLETHPPIPSAEVVGRLRAECDALVVPMAFEARHAANMRVCFPSKLADYTATGLPLLIWGPAYSSANVWALAEGGGVGEVVEVEDEETAAAAVRRLANDPAYRQRLGHRAWERGETSFSHREVSRRFFNALRRPLP